MEEFKFRRTTTSDKGRILNILRHHFYPDQPFWKLFCETENDFDKVGEDMEAFIIPQLDNGLSFLVEDGQTGKIVGLQLLTLITKTVNNPPPSAAPSFKHPGTPIFLECKKLMSQGADVFKLHPEINSYCTQGMRVVRREYRRKGLSKAMKDYTINLLNSQGVTILMGSTPVRFLMEAEKKAGFEPIYTLPLDKIKDKEGNKLIPKAKEGDAFVVRVLRIS